MKFLAGIFALGATLSFATAAYAQSSLTVTISSFEMVGNDPSLQLGEVCGQVTGNNNSNVNLTVMADYNTNNPGEYHTFTGPDGNFCEVIRTLNGTVQVNPLGTLNPSIARATLSPKASRNK